MTWHRESKRHSLASRGIKTVQKIRFIPKPPFLSQNKLPVQIGIIVPSTEKDKKISDKEFEKRIDQEKRWFTNRFGGDTSIKTVGSYFDGGKFILEKGILVQSSTNVDTYMKKRNLLAKHLLDRKKQWKQDSMLMKIEGQDFIVPKKNYIKHDKNQDDMIMVT